MPLTDKDISTLLRLKRHEQPPPGYFEDFLTEFHRRQRAELLKRPLWRICLDRVENFFGEFAVPRTAYGAVTGVFAVLLVAGVLATSKNNSSSPELAGADLVHDAGTNAEGIELWNHLPELPAPGVRQAVYPVSETPRYVLDVRPVSYEGTFSF